MINLNFFQSDLESKVLNICNNIIKNSELEISFTSNKRILTLKKYNNLLKYLSIKSKNDNLIIDNITSLDILYNYDSKNYNTYRLSIFNINNINNFIQDNYLLNNHIIFSRQIYNYNNNINNDNIILINKIRSSSEQLFLDEYDIKIRLSQENDVSDNEINKLLNLEEIEKHNIFYRYKQRLSLIIEDNDNYKISIDLTDVKSSNNLIKLINEKSNYELEIDITFKKKIKLKEILNTMANLIYKLEQFLQESNLLITKSQKLNVIKEINKLCYGSNTDIYKDIPIMQSVSTELYHIVDIIPGNYVVSDKADGDRYFLMIYDNNIYLISILLEIKKIKEITNSDYNSTILDGEYVYIPKYKKFIFLAFDILFIKGEDIRDNELLQDRLKELSDVLKNVFNINFISGIYSKEYDIDKIYKFNKDNIYSHFKELNKLLKQENINNIIYGKYIIFPMIASSNSDIFKLSTLIWDSYTKDNNVSCPYMLDGLMYTPIAQKYTKNIKETKYKILKWKPENKNSIDFYITFERDNETNKILSIYDKTITNHLNDIVNIENINELSNQVGNDIYQILNLHVGNIKNNNETPILFKKDEELYQAYIYIKDNYPRDIEGNIIQDKTVVEFIYDLDSNKDNKFKWIPLKTRYDKTEFVRRYKRKYGNNMNIANKIWESILNPVKYNDIVLLSNDNTYSSHIKELKNKITSKTIALAKRDDTYFQVITNLAKPLRSFHNWIKSNMIYMYCSEKILSNNKKVKMDVLDIGVGKAQDLLKFYHARINYAVGIDINEAGIYSGSDGAISRYNAFKKKMPNFPKITFLVADPGHKLDYSNQLKTNLVNENNINLLKQIFGNDDASTSFHTFNIINCQFMIHYLLKDKITWDNFCYNINKYLKKDGYILITTLDGSEVHNNFVDNHINRIVLLDNGEKRLLFDIVKKYELSDFSNLKKTEDYLGLPIDVHMPTFMDEGIYQTEYLVLPSFLINELRIKCNMRLVETELFGNLYYIYEDFFKNIAIHESKLETRKFFMDVNTYYNENNIESMNWLEYTKLHRYYIFQKII